MAKMPPKSQPGEDHLKDTECWIQIQARGMDRLSEIELANILLDSVCDGDNTDTVTPGNILGVQFYQGSWIIYTDSKMTKAKILSVSSIIVNGKQFEMTDFTTARSKPSGIRVSIHGIPYNVSDAELETWVDSWAKRCSPVMRAKAKSRNAEATNRFEHLYSGNRFCYVSEVREPQPRFTTYSMPNPLKPSELIDTNITLYHDGQEVNCRRCRATDHTVQECPGARTRAQPTQNKNLTLFRGQYHPLSNFYNRETLTFQGKEFNSGEQAYQWCKTQQLADVEKAADVLQAGTPAEARRIGNSLEDTEDWGNTKVNKMRDILAAKFEQSQAFREKLESSGDSMLVEATFDKFWGSGLDPRDTAETPIDEWPGRNKTGQLLMELKAIKAHPTTSAAGVTHPEPVPATPGGSQGDTVRLAQDLIDHALGRKSVGVQSPELLEKVTTFLADHRISVTSEQGTPVKDMAEAAAAGSGGVQVKRKDISPPAEPQPQKKNKQKTHIKSFFTKAKKPSAASGSSTTFDPG